MFRTSYFKNCFKNLEQLSEKFPTYMIRKLFFRRVKYYFEYLRYAQRNCKGAKSKSPNSKLQFYIIGASIDSFVASSFHCPKQQNA